MLYDCWRKVAFECRTRIALWDSTHGRCWTFGELAQAAEQGASEPSRPLCEPRCSALYSPPQEVKQAQGFIAFPSGLSAEFIIAVLRAWRSQQVVCPLEPGQTPPKIETDLPAGIVHLKTTSASTGAASLVAFTAPQLMADAKNIVETMGLRADWPNLGVISLAHSYGFSNLVLPMLLHGIPLILAEAPLPETLKRVASTQPAVTLPAVPALWRAWQDADALPANICLAISAGAPLPLALEQSVFAARGIKIHNFYGSSECGGIAYDATPQPRLDASCIGAPMRNVEVVVAEDGCLEVRSNAVGQTYWPEPTPNLREGVFHTSDLGEISSGRVYLRGRATDLINVAGRKVLPETIERALAAHPGVRACVAFGVPSADAQRGEMIVACVAGLSGITSEVLKQFALERLPAWQVPREWWLVDSLDANHRGKLPRAEWRSRFLEKKA